MLYDDIPNSSLPQPGIYIVMSFHTDKDTHITETTTHGYFHNCESAKRKFQQVADYAAKEDADPDKSVLLDTATEFVYRDKYGDECHVLIHYAS